MHLNEHDLQINIKDEGSRKNQKFRRRELQEKEIPEKSASYLEE